MTFLNDANRFIKAHMPAILASGAVVGSVATAIFAAKAGFKTAQKIEAEKDKLRDKDGVVFIPEGVEDPFTPKNLVKLLWKDYLPAGVSCVATIGCIAGSTKVGSRRIFAATMAYSLTEQAFAQYKEKVIEQIGENKEQAIRDQITAERVLKNPPQMKEILACEQDVVFPGEVLCCETYTGRYFKNSMEGLRKAQNDLNARLIKEDRSTLGDFYHLIGLKATQFSDDLGWMSDKLLELEFSTHLAEDGKPCLAFEYNYVRPLYDSMGFFKRDLGW